MTTTSSNNATAMATTASTPAHNVKECQSKTTYTMKNYTVTPLKDRRPRIIVEVMETDLKAAGESANTKAASERPTSRQQRETRIDIINSSSLMFHMKASSSSTLSSSSSATNSNHNGIATTSTESCKRIMQFDCVANGAADQVIRWQMSSLVDRLLIAGRNNCCLLRISPQRHLPTLHVLSHILIPEINKRLSSPEIAPLLLYAIRVEYYDVRKYDVVNMVLRASPKNRPRHHLTFRNTWELLHWVQEVYPSLFALGAGHECLDLKFIFIRDRSGVKVRVKLSLLQFFLSKMDADMIAGLRNFLENAGANSSGRIKHSILTDYLREYFFSPDNWHIWMVFEAPTNKSNTVINDVLTMASSAYAGVQGLIEGKAKVDTVFTARPDIETDVLRPVLTNSNLTPENSRSTTPKTIALSTAVSNNALKFRKKEKQSLSYWYRQMDERFLNVLHAMEAFYARKNRIAEMNSSAADGGNGNRRQLNARPQRERREFCSTVRNPPKEAIAPMQIPPDYALHTLTLNYKQAVDNFYSLINQIERCPFAGQLKILLQTKNEELTQHLEELRLKPIAIKPHPHPQPQAPQPQPQTQPQNPPLKSRSEKDSTSLKSRQSTNAS